MQTVSVVRVDKNRSPGCAVHGKVWIHGTDMRMGSQSSPGTALVFCPYVRAAGASLGERAAIKGASFIFFIALSTCKTFLGLNTFLQQFC